MAIRWDEFPHHEIRLKIYARLAPNGVGRAAEDSKLHILRRQLSSLRHEDHRRFVELQARHLVEHLRCTRDVYREFVDSKGCRPVLEAQWVVLRFAVLPTKIAILRQKVIEYAKLTRVRGRDITLLFGIITASCSRKADHTPDEPFRFLQPPDLDDETPATDEELESLAQLIDEDRLVVLEDIRDGGSVFRFHGGGPFSVDDYGSIHLSFDMCGLIHAGISLPDWVSIRKRLWNLGTPWTEGLCGLFGAVQEELMSQWQSLPSDSRAHDYLNKKSSFRSVVVPADEKLSAGRKSKRPDSFVRYAGRLWQDAISKGKTSAKACLLASGCYENCGLLQSRVGNLKVSDLWSAVDHFRQDLQHFWIAAAEIGVRVLLLVPKTDSDHFRSCSGGDEYDFVLEAVLFLKEGKNLVLDGLGKLRTGIGLQVHGNVTRKHVNLLGFVRLRGGNFRWAALVQGI
jgi:hypothetical protein